MLRSGIFDYPEKRSFNSNLGYFNSGFDEVYSRGDD